jgi:hypothetical protein
MELSHKNKIIFVDIGKYKWKVIIKPNDKHIVENVPFCIEHDLQLVEDNGIYICPHFGDEFCKNSMEEDSRGALYKGAVSLAEKKLRRKKIIF